MLAYQLKLEDQVVNGRCWGADETVLAADEAEEHGKLEVAQVVDFVDESIVCHDKSSSAGDASLDSIRVGR